MGGSDEKSKNLFDSKHDKFGQVFLLRRNAAEVETIELLKGVKFSNLHLCLLQEGTTQEEKSWQGRKYSLGLSGYRLDVPFPLGARAPVDSENLDAAVAREVEVVRELKLLDEENESKSEIVRSTRMTLCWAVCTPGSQLLEQDFLIKVSPFAYLDDFLESFEDAPESDSDSCENETVLARQKMRLPYKLTYELFHTISKAVVLGENDQEKFETLMDNALQKTMEVIQEDGYTEMLDSPDFDLTELYCFANSVMEFISCVRRAALETGNKKRCSSQALQRYMAELLDTFCLEYSKEWHQTVMQDGSASIMLPTMTALRRTTVAGVLILESILLQLGIHLEETVRSTTLSKLIMDQVATHFQKVNDLVSFEKEINGRGNEWRNNEACILHKEKGMSVEEAKRKMADDANGALKQMEKLTLLLEDVWTGKMEENSVKRFVETVKNVITGHMQWCALVGRYHDDLVLDCFIIEDN